eukprot:8788332-Alexandrium_andersonii.AAC.1
MKAERNQLLTYIANSLAQRVADSPPVARTPLLPVPPPPPADAPGGPAHSAAPTTAPANASTAPA